MATGQREVDDFTKQQLEQLAVSLENMDPKERKKLHMNRVRVCRGGGYG